MAQNGFVMKDKDIDKLNERIGKEEANGYELLNVAIGSGDWIYAAMKRPTQKKGRKPKGD